MIKFDIITIFPEIFTSYLKESLISRAQKKKLIKINVHNLRDWTKDAHKTVDDRPFGGGLGMVLKVEPIYEAVQSLTKNSKAASAKASASQGNFDYIFSLHLDQKKPVYQGAHAHSGEYFGPVIDEEAARIKSILKV